MKDLTLLQEICDNLNLLPNVLVALIVQLVGERKLPYIDELSQFIHLAPRIRHLMPFQREVGWHPSVISATGRHMQGLPTRDDQTAMELQHWMETYPMWDSPWMNTTEGLPIFHREHRYDDRWRMVLGSFLWYNKHRKVHIRKFEDLMNSGNKRPPWDSDSNSRGEEPVGGAISLRCRFSIWLTQCRSRRV